ncbi:MAG: KTSC domain-containing protein, partial [Planctomycetota bacterium]
ETAEDLNRGIDAARKFLEEQGFEVKPPSSKAGGSGLGGSSSGGSGGGGVADKDVEQAAAEVDAGQRGGAGGRGRGGSRKQPKGRQEPGGTLPQGIPKQRADGRDRKVVDLDLDGSGPKRRFPVSHPIVTRELIRTPESSNVYGFRYDIDRSTLYVRYLQATASGGGKTMGPLYGYSNVPPDVFLAMIDAPSKGTFIWDRIRIRGTVSGHRYDYRLVAVRHGYVPRKATFTPDGEQFIGRTVRAKRVIGDRKVRTFSSRLPDAPARGTPNRGAPDRGAPNRGR